MEETGKVRRSYDAFISYRHRAVDKDCAVRLQKLLERHKITDPATGKKRRLRVFRDETELPTSGDLGADIREALENSRFLIVICSESLRESRWCMEEFHTFRRLHGDSNFHILPLLAEGEPDTSFPEELRWEKRRIEAPDGSGTEYLEETEPLGADVRSPFAGRRRRLLKTEYLRIAAPILGCGFEDLYRRRQRRRRRQAAVSVTAAAAAAALFSGYNMFMVGKIAETRDQMYEKQSLRLAEAAEREREGGDYALSMLLAEAALPEEAEGSGRIGAAEAEAALRSAVTERKIQEEKEVFQKQAQVRFQIESWELCGVYDGGRKAAATDFEYTYLYDVGNGELLFRGKGEMVYFDSEARRAVQVETLNNGTTQIALFETETGKKYFSGIYENGESDSYFGIYEEQSGRCYIVRHSYEEETRTTAYEAVESISAEGERRAEEALPEEIERRCRDGYEYSFFDMEFSTYMDRTGILGEAPPEAEKPKKILEELGCRVDGLAAIGDGELLLFTVYSQEGLTDDNQETQYTNTVVWSNEWECWLDVFSGECLYEEQSGLLYHLRSDGFDIYSCRPENIQPETENSAGQRYKRISADGERCMSLEDTYLGEEGYRTCLRVWDSGDLSEPLFEEEIASYPPENRYLYFMSGDMKTVFYGTPDGMCRLWKAEEGRVLEFEPGENAEYPVEYDGNSADFMDMLAVDEEGERLALAFGGRSGEGRVEIRSAEDGSLLQEIRLGEEQIKGVFTHLEFDGSRLLACGSVSSVLIDLETGEPERSFGHGNQGYNQDYFLTEDGLLFCTSYYTSSYCLDAVYDTETGEQLFDGQSRIVRRYAYDAESGVLAYQVTVGMSDTSTGVQLARRNEDGSFEDTLAITPEEPNLMLRTDGQSLDGRYLLLNGSESCEVYDTESGARVLSVGETGYALAGGKLFDLEQRTDRVRSYPILTEQELREEADRFLTSELGRRELSEAEKREYFIS